MPPAESITESLYELKLKGHSFSAAPCVRIELVTVKTEYLGKNIADGRQKIADFPQTGTRELLADDYIYQLKRLAHPRLHSPIFGMMADKIVGLKALGKS